MPISRLGTAVTAEGRTRYRPGLGGPRESVDDDYTYFARTARERWVRYFIGTLTLMFGLCGVLMAASGIHYDGLAGFVLAGSLTTIPVAVAWFVRPWPSPRLANAFVFYADVGIVAILFSSTDHYVPLTGCMMFTIVAVFTVIASSYRVVWAHLAVSMATLLTLAVLATNQGTNPWLVAATAVTVVTLYLTPLMMRAYIRHLRSRASGAVVDSLTGLYNRRGLLEALDDVGTASTDSAADRTIGVTVLDIDRFKDINDRFGHPTGDAVLIEIAARLTAAVPKTSVVSRLSGDEFVIVHIGVPGEIASTDNRIRSGLDESFSGPPFTASAGSASELLGSEPVTPAVVRKLIALADIEMYRNKSRLSGDDGSARGSSRGTRADIRTRIEDLISRGGPDVVFQPICDTVTRAVVGYEALSRFPFGYGSPTMWFRDATNAGIGPLLEVAAIDRALAASESLPCGIFISLNASADTIRSTDLTSTLKPFQKDRQFHIEITEHERVDDYLAVARSIESLRAAGIFISVDDVGAGFAGLRQVVELRPDTLKVDYALVHGIDTDAIRRAAAASVIGFAHEIGSTVIMEGVETEAELRVAVELGADMVQGLLTGRPLPLADTVR
ncbi:bifunctional diguanylate cyclase/phosphodiesterase [Rhodococcus sp. 06-235-1A]|uniref:bifunctional diguanylate cyclase/phosphodiesterase n=1 Tax=Rhodococcus sp. 06-235-1A TaxID=2022508 RepID=UPI00211AD833|nr:bifunctional diguanylate cyclase/phosphodiesterase [Rhodococcus sp. 06-235-1A]